MTEQIRHSDIDDDLSSVLSSLESLQEIPVTEHVAVFDTVQRQLSDLLADVDDA
ncbi:hypothetical protein [Haloglycomyces albus]|uniref:hypothetical protein n=1 Tax=Haloglycomyces albus TaxID=526067 RepID=UPI0004BC29C7|nr:hypothetical protein [Haloglycomyces albus]